MASTRNFDIYVKKDLFSLLLVAGLFGLSFYFAQQTMDNSLDNFDATLNEYGDIEKEMKDDLNYTNKRFKIFNTQLKILERQNYKRDCSNDIQQTTPNVRTLVS